MTGHVQTARLKRATGPERRANARPAGTHSANFCKQEGWSPWPVETRSLDARAFARGAGRPGTLARRAEVASVAEILRSLGLRTAAIQEPATLDGGDVLQAGHTVYVGRGGRTNGAGIRQLRALLAPLGLAVIAVPLRNGPHLKSAVTALPDSTFLLLPQLVPAGLFPAVRPVRKVAAMSSRWAPAGC